MSGQEKQCNYRLKSNWQPQDEEGEEIGKGDLGQDIDQLELKLAAGDVYQYLAENDQHEGAPSYVPKDLPGAVTFGNPVGMRERHCHPHHKHESRLDEVPKNKPLPSNVLELASQPVPARLVTQSVQTEGM